MKRHTISSNECIASLSAEAGLTIDKIWGQRENSALSKRRGHPHVLCRGDMIAIPDRETAQNTADTERIHRYKRDQMLVKLRLRLLRSGEPISDARYVLQMPDRIIEGRTDNDGLLEETVPASATAAKLLVESDEFELEIGDLDPVSELTGVQARLTNLGYESGKIDGLMGPITRQALEIFQEDYELEVRGEPDEPTRNKLRELHGV